MSTLVGSQAASGVQPRAIHAGVNSVYGDYDLAATLGVGDVVQLVKLPDALVELINLNDLNFEDNETIYHSKNILEILQIKPNKNIPFIVTNFLFIYF